MNTKSDHERVRRVDNYYTCGDKDCPYCQDIPKRPLLPFERGRQQGLKEAIEVCKNNIGRVVNSHSSIEVIWDGCLSTIIKALQSKLEEK